MRRFTHYSVYKIYILRVLWCFFVQYVCGGLYIHKYSREYIYNIILYTHGTKFLINIIQNMFGAGEGIRRLKDLKD